jgi:hypothetical protein
MKLVIVVVKLLLLGALFIISNNSLHLSDSVERGQFVDLYTDWLDGLVEQSVEITGYLVKFEWLPDKDLTVENKVMKEAEKIDPGIFS